MSDLAVLYEEFDPLRALGAEQEELYVDWQKRLDADDVKQNLTNAIARSGSRAITRLFTGHRGVGKTTELFRVKRRLESGEAGRRFLVSMLLAERWLDLPDVQPEDVILQIVRQLVTDLRKTGFELAVNRFTDFFNRLRSLLQREIDLEAVEIKLDPLKLSFAVQDLPSGRSELRRLLRGQLPTLYDLVNKEILKQAREWIARPENGGYEDILIIVDQLDRMPRKVLNGHGLTNHVNLFLDHAGTLRSLNCSVLYTIPIELAYSKSQVGLRDTYGSPILSLPAIPVMDRRGAPDGKGLAVLRDIVERRASRAGLGASDIFESSEMLDEVLSLSGGHVRSLFVLFRSILDRSERLPVRSTELDRTLRRVASDFALPLHARDWRILDSVHESKAPFEEDSEAWYELLRELYVLAYKDDDGYWYERNPLLSKVPRAGSS